MEGQDIALLYSGILQEGGPRQSDFAAAPGQRPKPCADADSVKKAHECGECGKCFRHPHRLRIHAITHAPAAHKPHACDICGKCFRYRNYLGVHRRLHDTSEHPYKCKYCAEYFHSLSKRRQHMAEEHMEAKTFLCPLCPSVLTAPCLLSAHLKRHANERDHVCDACAKRFYSRHQLQEHTQAVHTDQRPYECETCHMRFQRKSHRSQHLKLHASTKAYCCQLCDKAFAQKAGLFGHMRTHKNQRRPDMES